MKNKGLRSSLMMLLFLSGAGRAQDSGLVPPPPTAEDASAAPSDKSSPVPATGQVSDQTPELLPPGKLATGAREKSVLQPSSAPRIRLPEQPLTVVDAVVLTHNHVGDGVLVNLIQRYGVARPLAGTDVMTLHNEGVSDSVIAAMQQAPCPAPAVTVEPPPPIMVQQPVVVSPPVYAPPVVIERYPVIAPPPVRYYYHGYYGPYYPHHGPRWGISVYGR